MSEVPYDKIETDKAKEEFAARRQMAKEDEEKILKSSGAMVAEAVRLADGGADFALLNLVLSTVDCKKIIKQGSIRKAWYFMYELLWPHIRQLINDNKALKKEIEIEIDYPEGVYPPRLKEIMERKDPITYSKEVLAQIQEAARRRSKKGVYKPQKTKLVVD